MKFFLTLTFFIFVTANYAQTTKTTDSSKVMYPEPEWALDILYYDSLYPKGMQLEKLHGEEKTNGNAALYVTGIGKVSSKVVFSGPESSVRIIESDTLVFIARYTSNEINPSEVINLYKVSSTKKKREIETGSVGTFSGFSTDDLERVSFSAEKYGEHSYIIYVTNLQPGEYAFGFSESYDSFMLFGIDKNMEDLTAADLEVGDSTWIQVEGEWTACKVVKKENGFLVVSYADLKGKTRKTRRPYERVYVNKDD